MERSKSHELYKVNETTIIQNQNYSFLVAVLFPIVTSLLTLFIATLTLKRQTTTRLNRLCILKPEVDKDRSKTELKLKKE